ncbi:MAG TPA: cytochrome P450 [Ktedonobacteraceae bacterium]|nr:cytochrome P450 [Ktedonobacteraceae bacterium]
MATIFETPNATDSALPPGPRPLPFIGNVLAFRRDQLGFLQELERTYGKMATIYIGTTPVVLLCRPEHVRYVLTENPRNFTNREMAEGLRQLIGDGLLTIDGEAHRQQRRLVQPAFHRKRIEGYAATMTQYAQEMLADWRGGDRLDVARAMQELTLRIVAKCLFNVDLADQVNELGDAFSGMIDNPVGLLEGFLNIRVDSQLTAYGRRMAARRRVDEFIYALIAQRRADDGQDKGDVLSMLLAAQESGEGEEHLEALSDTQVRDHIMTFVAAGHETTANALTWTFYLLSRHAEARERLLAELESVLAGRTPTLEDLPQLPYLEWVLNESMRLYPPAWVQGRRSIEAFDLDGVHFPAGTMVLFSQWVIQRLPGIWGDAEAFRPERWDPASDAKTPPWSYFPFGGGPRICIGMPFAQLEAKLLLATILQRFTPRVDPGYRLELNPLITLRPKHRMPVVLLPTGAADAAEGAPAWEGLLYGNDERQQEGYAERKGCLGAFMSLFL